MFLQTILFRIFVYFSDTPQPKGKSSFYQNFQREIIRIDENIENDLLYKESILKHTRDSKLLFGCYRKLRNDAFSRIDSKVKRQLARSKWLAMRSSLESTARPTAQTLLSDLDKSTTPEIANLNTLDSLLHLHLVKKRSSMVKKAIYFLQWKQRVGKVNSEIRNITIDLIQSQPRCDSVQADSRVLPSEKDSKDIPCIGIGQSISPPPYIELSLPPSCFLKDPALQLEDTSNLWEVKPSSLVDNSNLKDFTYQYNESDFEGGFDRRSYSSGYSEEGDLKWIQSQVPFHPLEYTIERTPTTICLTFPKAGDPLARALKFQRHAIRFKQANIHYLVGACGTGKTRRCPDIIRGRKKIVIFIPTIKAVQGAFDHYKTLGSSWARCGGVTYSTSGATPDNATYTIMTTGAAMADKSRWCNTTSSHHWMIDEAHTESKAVQKILNFASNYQVDVTLVSATPSTPQVPWFNEKCFTQRWHLVQGVNLPRPAAKTYRWAAEAVRKKIDPFLLKGSVLVIGGTLTECERYEGLFEDRRFIVALSRNHVSLYDQTGQVERKTWKSLGKVDLSKDILSVVGQDVLYLATPAVEVGVTIPDLMNVVVTNQVNLVDKTRDKNGFPWKGRAPEDRSEDTYFNQLNTCSWVSTIQRAGRVNRTCEGATFLFDLPSGTQNPYFGTDGRLEYETITYF